MASHQQAAHQKPLQQDWANREYMEVITGSIKKISDFLNSFDVWGINPQRPALHYNASAHRTLAAKEILWENNVHVMNPWLDISPDMNDIDTCHAGIILAMNPQPQMRQQLQKALVNVWNNVPQHFISDTSCRSRLATLNQKLTELERRVEYIEARVANYEPQNDHGFDEGDISPQNAID